ncbi:hypothetical protein ACSBR1_004232 [Camellia fascicularis]
MQKSPTSGWPKWQRNKPISVKDDVYSYGIVLLEIVCCRRNLEVNVSTPKEVVFSNWFYRCFAGRELNKLIVVGDEEVDMKTLENMVKVGLWCIQDELALRPSMKNTHHLSSLSFILLGYFLLLFVSRISRFRTLPPS